MKLGIFLVIAGGIIAIWFFCVPLWLVFFRWLDTGVFSVNWSAMWQSLAIGFFGGGIPLTIGQDKIRKANKQND